MEFEIYNKKAFLLPDSINSMAAYHAKLFADGRYMFRIHDCNTGIRLIGELKCEQDYLDAFDKLSELSIAAIEFAFHIDAIRNKIYNENPNEDGSDYQKSEENAGAAKEVLQVS